MSKQSSGYGLIYGVGNNEITVKDKIDIHSGGNSKITMTGTDSVLYLAENDIIDSSTGYENRIYSAGYKNNSEPLPVQNININGNSNTLKLGTSPYEVSLNGYGSIIEFSKINTNVNTINIEEENLNTIIISNDISDLTINTNNDFEIQSGVVTKSVISNLVVNSTSEINTGATIKNIDIDNLNVVIKSDLQINEVSSSNINVNTNGYLDIQKTISPITEINSSSDISISNSNLDDLHIISTSNTGYGNAIEIRTEYSSEVSKINKLKVESDNSNTLLNLNGVALDSEINNVYLSGTFKTNKLKLNGVADNLTLMSDEQSAIEIDGSIKTLTLQNINGFKYRQSIPLIQKSILNLTDSIITDEINDFTSVSITAINSTISGINFEGLDFELLAYPNSNVSNLNINANISAKLNIDSQVNSVKISKDDFEFNAQNITNSHINIENEFNISFDNSSVTYIDSNIQDEIILNANNISDLNLVSGVFNTNIKNIGSLVVDFSKVKLVNNNVLSVANNIKINTLNNIKYYKQDNKYYINGIELLNRPEEIKINNKTYGFNELNILDKYLDDNSLYAILKNGEIQYHVANYDNQSEKYIPELVVNEGDITGSGESGIINLNKNIPYIIFGSESFVTYNFTGEHEDQNLFNYIVNNGRATFNTGAYTGIKIKLNGVLKNDLSYNYKKDLATNIEFLDIKNKGNVILTLNNYSKFAISLLVIENGSYVLLEDNVIRSNLPPLEYVPENPNPPTGPTNPTEPSNPTTPTNPTNPTNPPSNVYSGTAGNDYQTLSENVAYTINSSAGNDTYEFTMGNGNNNVLNYAIGSGLTTIKTSGNNFVFLNIKFSNIDKSLLSFSILRNQLGNESELTISYNKIAIIKINNYINVGLLINITNNGESITMNNTDIEASLYNINGTDGDDNLIGNTTNSIFNPGKGTDLINIIGGSNRINYKAGDGYKTVINPTFSYVMVVFDSSIDKKLIKYALGDNNSLNIKYNNELIFTLKQPNASGLQFSDYSIVNGYEIIQGLSTINGTDADEIIEGNASGPSIINPKKGTDIINLIGGQNTINYFIGDGYKTINSTGLYYQININGEVDNLLLSYVKNGDEAIDVKYNDEIIFSISDPYSATIALTSTNKYIFLSQVYNELNAIKGTDGDDILYGAENGSYVIGKKGNDEINLIGGYNTIGYAIGDGHDTIKGGQDNMIRLSGVIDRELLTFEQVETQMNVSYDGEVILTVEQPYISNIQIEETYEFIILSDYMTNE